jgi:hypothetical protein
MSPHNKGAKPEHNATLLEAVSAVAPKWRRDSGT